jgi:hypothetical protein
MCQDIISGERRMNRRYEVTLECRIFRMDTGECQIGSGVARELSRGGLRFVTDVPPPAGAEVEVRIAWPFKLQNICPLELVMKGVILRTDYSGTALKARGYEFRTCGTLSFSQGADNSSFSLVA